ncbi:hypothetical protein [Indioceanicola profundi]|uniref:hypothetical protein n=1 Tax=Indioceanicola profundi TaxID=2220096 RepID=UPI000E6AC816|nr:hypothetical protein [Indioceanicola profundi]
MEQDGPKQDPNPEQKAEQTAEQKPKRRSTQKVGPWEWNWHPADPQPMRSISPADLSPEERARLESSIGGLSSARKPRSEKPE